LNIDDLLLAREPRAGAPSAAAFDAAAWQPLSSRFPRAEERRVHIQETSFGHVLALEPGDELIRSLIEFARHREVDAAVLAGLGSVKGTELGFYHLARQEYERHRFDEPLEACSLTGNIALLDGEPFPHVHGVFSRPDCTTIGGHVFEAVCAVTLEIAVYRTEGALVRGPVDYCNLKLLRLEDRP
jgi:predicted DNA-binding protein with PD1-like motif